MQASYYVVLISSLAGEALSRVVAVILFGCIVLVAGLFRLACLCNCRASHGIRDVV